jgi:light-regulated signal transduction histidine kinase (bacteriophytochrome)
VQELEALRREQQALGFGLSHDLHAPLRAIDSFAWQLERNATLDATARDHVQRVRAAAARMSRLLERLQLFVNAGVAPLQAQRVDVSLLAEWIGADLRDAAPTRAITLRIQPGLHATGDERLLRTLLVQLLDNACRFSEGDPRIEVEGEDAAAGMALRVRDRGIGFDTAAAGKLGQPFQRLHADDSCAGSGLGLAIATRIVARHGGTLHLESTPGAGTTVHLFLPERLPAEVA